MVNTENQEKSKFEESPVKNVGKRLFKLITSEIVFGNTEVHQGINGPEFHIKEPYTSKNGQLMPYMIQELGNAPAAINIHPMNVIWQVPLDEFKEAYDLYVKATSRIII